MLKNMKEIIKKDCWCVLLCLVEQDDFTTVNPNFLYINYNLFGVSFYY